MDKPNVNYVGPPDAPYVDVPQLHHVAGYERLAEVLVKAYEQSAGGKGRERHAQGGRAFEDQPIVLIPHTLGGIAGLGGLVYQVQKKAGEAVGMTGRSQHMAAMKELLGAIVYASAAYMHVENMLALHERSLKELATLKDEAYDPRAQNHPSFKGDLHG